MDGFAQRMADLRKKYGMTQNEVAEKLDVSFQSVSLWERGEASPDMEKLGKIATLYHVSLDWLLLGKKEERVYLDFQGELSDRLFDENRMYTYIRTYATLKGMNQTVRVLPYVRKLHSGQYRKGKDKVPYIYHPLLIACHALALGLDDDDLVSAALLHDVCEDCYVPVQDFPVSEAVKRSVDLLTKRNDVIQEDYYRKIASDPIAAMVKLLDRCNNVSGMAAGFSREKLVAYIRETEQYVYPLIKRAKHEYPWYSNQIFLIKYHMTSVMEAIKHRA